jgi:hypothetical protein
VRQVDLAQRPLVELGAHGHAAALGRRWPERLARAALVGGGREALLVVGGVVLDAAHHALRLGGLDPVHAHSGHEVRVLAVALERAATERRAHDVQRGRVDHVVALQLHLVGDDVAVAARHARVEGGCDRHRYRQRGRLALPWADRAVAVVGRRQRDPFDAVARARVLVGTARDAEEVVTAEQCDLLVARELGEEELGAGFGRHRGVAPRMVAAAAGGVGARRDHQRDRCADQREQHPSHAPNDCTDA